MFARRSSSAPGSPASLGSDAMDESDDDADNADDADDIADVNPYPLEGKYKNASDRAYVMGLSVLEQEELLADRAEEQAQKSRESQLKSLLNSRTADPSKKRKAAAELEEERRPARAKTGREKLLDSYKSQREQAKEGGRRGRTIGRSTRRSRSRSDASSRDASGSPDVQSAPTTAASKELDFPVELQQIERIRVGRTRLAQNCFNPRFEESMIGCFARVCIGQNSQRENEYRMTTIKAIVTGPPYLVDASPAVPKFYTDQYVMLAHGKAQKQWPFNNCSDSQFSERELNRWKQQMVTDTVPMVTRGEAENTLTGIHNLLNHHLSSAEINEKVAKREKYRHLFAEAAPAVKRSTQTEDAAERLRQRNEKIRKQDAEERRKTFAQQIKKKNALMKQAAAARASASQDTLAVPKSDIDALFSEGSDVSRPASPAPAVGSGTSTPQKHKSGRFTKMTMDDDVIGSMDLAIDIEI